MIRSSNFSIRKITELVVAACTFDMSDDMHGKLQFNIVFHDTRYANLVIVTSLVID